MKNLKKINSEVFYTKSSEISFIDKNYIKFLKKKFMKQKIKGQEFVYIKTRKIGCMR